MSRNKRRAREFAKSDENTDKKWLSEIKEEMSRVEGDIALLLHSRNIPVRDVKADVWGLDHVEGGYRTLARTGAGAHDEDIEKLERLMAILLGKVIIAMHTGNWIVYRGSNRTFSPLVVAAGEDHRKLDVFAVTAQLSRKQGLAGAAEGKSLSTYAQRAMKIGFV